MTNKYSLATLILILSLAVIASCAKKEGDYLQVIEGNWGHLSEIERTLPSKLYLSHVKKNDSYNVCLARYMTADFPGIEEEIKAAVNIWAHYIGRSINVSITKVDLPRPSEDSPEEDYQKEFVLIILMLLWHLVILTIQRLEKPRLVIPTLTGKGNSKLRLLEEHFI